ncbi:flavin reductase family protein [Candidatus Solincola sp.]|jgi:flavin reductase (DIM6/NTAB) family NADH-FMN oxidoreductase RutF|nr:flavin reductase family protein [Actinomycetota bacterium]MDI7251201.1 flavin reductase family protein [Actinomycetota bacterium]
MEKVVKKASTLFLPKPVVLITAAHGGRDNVMTAAWANVVCMEPPQVAVAVRESRFTHGLIKGSGEFAVNVPSRDLWRAVDLCGMVSGRDRDKFRLAGLTRERGREVVAPLVAECPLNIECRVSAELPLGSHTLFVGLVLAVHLASECEGEKGAVDVEAFRPFVLNHREYWDMGRKLGRYGETASELEVIP